MSTWSKKYPACVRCETTSVAHHAYGLCRRCYAVRRAVLHPEKLQQYSKAYAKVNREKKRQASREWYRNNPDKAKERNRRRTMLRQKWPIGGTVKVELSDGLSFEAVIVALRREAGLQTDLTVGGWCLDLQGTTFHEAVPVGLCTLIKLPPSHKRKVVPLDIRIERKKRRNQ